MTLLNPLQIAGTLNEKPADVTAIIRICKIPAQKQGLRAGLYDLDAVKQALSNARKQGEP